jgi:hypothetical protein
METMNKQECATEASECARLMKLRGHNLDPQAIYDRIMAETPRRCYVILQTVVNRNGEYIPCIVEEGTPGYYPTDWHWGKDLKLAEKLAHEQNEKMGIFEDEADFIETQSMRIQNVRNRKAARK